MTTQKESKILSKCPAEIALKVINGRWKLLILKELFLGTKRFNELQRALSGVTQKVLTQQLRELESDGIINRTVYPEIPLKVEYSLTALGGSLKPLTEVMHDWGVNQSSNFKHDLQ
jgi:DNA-binding HxlR family transcriptional regulator